jgi:RNA-directed DNA polymerase
MTTKDEKAKLYDRVVRQVPEELLVDRMQLHGFWPEGQEPPPDPPEEVAERQAIEAEIDKLRKRALKVDAKAALQKERVRRWQESKKRRTLARQDRDKEREKRREAWLEKKRALVAHAGVGVSAGLGRTGDDLERLARFGLTALHDANGLAAALGIPLGKLRWLTFHRRGAALVHYHRYSIPKKTGAMRAISAPKRALRGAQEWVLREVLARVPVSSQAHGFVKERSVVTNATPHVKKKVVCNLDLEDFFPSITFARVRGLFHRIGYSPEVATLLALLCTEPPRVKAELDEQHYFIAVGERALPQGACTSPAITNLVCRRLDARLAGVAKKWNFAYTRYADDLTFSGDAVKDVGALLWGVRRILASEGFREHEKKTLVMRSGSRQEVTGVVVNDRPSIAREERRRLRAILHNAGKTGLAAQNRDDHPRFAERLRGKVAYLEMIDKPRALGMAQALARALEAKE